MKKPRVFQFLLNQAGVSIIEALAAAGILATSALTVTYIYNSQSQLENQAQLQKAILQVKKQLLETVKDEQSWMETISHTANPSMQCLKNKTDCKGQKGNISIFDLRGQEVASQSAAFGWDKNGKSDLCKTGFSKTSDQCLFRFNVSWEAICDSNPTCFSPLVKLRFDFDSSNKVALNNTKYGFEVLQNSSNKEQVDACRLVGGTLNYGLCDVPFLRSCPSGNYLNGFKDGAPVCKPIPSARCPAGQFLSALNKKEVTSLDDSGNPVKEEQLVAECVSPQKPPPFALQGQVTIGCKGRVDGAYCQNFIYEKTVTNKDGDLEDLYTCTGGHNHKCSSNRWVGYKMTVRVPSGSADVNTIENPDGKKQLVAPLVGAKFECEGWSGWNPKAPCSLTGPVEGKWPPPPPYKAQVSVKEGRNNFYILANDKFYLTKTEGGVDIFETEQVYSYRPPKSVKMIVRVPAGTATTSEEPDRWGRPGYKSIRLGLPTTGTLACELPRGYHRGVTPTCDAKEVK